MQIQDLDQKQENIYDKVRRLRLSNERSRDLYNEAKSTSEEHGDEFGLRYLPEDFIRVFDDTIKFNEDAKTDLHAAEEKYPTETTPNLKSLLEDQDIPADPTNSYEVMDAHQICIERGQNPTDSIYLEPLRRSIRGIEFHKSRVDSEIGQTNQSGLAIMKREKKSREALEERGYVVDDIERARERLDRKTAEIKNLIDLADDSTVDAWIDVFEEKHREAFRIYQHASGSVADAIDFNREYGDAGPGTKFAESIDLSRMLGAIYRYIEEVKTANKIGLEVKGEPDPLDHDEFLDN